MSKIIKRVDQITLIFSSIGLAGLMIVITAGVVTRYIFGFSIPTAYEITENYLMPITIFSALGYSYKSGIFPRVDAFVSKLKSDRLRQVINTTIIVVELLIFIIISYYIFQFSIYSFENSMGFSANSINFPLYQIYFLIFLSFTWMSIMIFLKLIRSIKDKTIDPYK